MDEISTHLPSSPFLRNHVDGLRVQDWLRIGSYGRVNGFVRRRKGIFGSYLSTLRGRETLRR